MKQCVLLSLPLLFTWSSTSEAFPTAIASSRSNGTKKFDLFGDIRETSEKTTKLDMMKELNRTDAHQAVAGTQSLTKWDDLTLAGLNARKLQFKYSIIYGSKPDIDDIYLNNDIAHKYGYFSYNYLGDVNVSNVHTEPKQPFVMNAISLMTVMVQYLIQSACRQLCPTQLQQQLPNHLQSPQH